MQIIRPHHRASSKSAFVLYATSILLHGLFMFNANAVAQSQMANYADRNGTPQIQAFYVTEVRRLAPGVDLDFNMYGTPGGQASLRIAGATRNVILNEVASGEYEGTYTINSRDRIAARSQVTANLRVGNQVSSEVLNESLQIGVGYHPKNAKSTDLQIQNFRLDASEDLDTGSNLAFYLSGNPGARVELTIGGVRGKILMTESGSGEYAANYIIRNRDKITPRSEVIAYLSLHDRTVSQHLARGMGGNAAQVKLTSPLKKPSCYNCGRVEAINIIETRGEGGYLGTIGGGVVGALIGSQVGGGNGRTAAQIAGAIGGAYAGRAIEGNNRKTSHFEVLVRLQNGAAQTLSFANDPGVHVNDQVKIDNGRLIRNP
ncbi:glycine zipper 2TM domain-containing protein [Undibacterium sp.]|uniref:glycine zipper 2TM domain-containing protein n=1 Tax=Undibacterium sp. TaxID=1914977 RepID=UPI003752F2E3